MLDKGGGHAPELGQGKSTVYSVGPGRRHVEQATSRWWQKQNRDSENDARRLARGSIVSMKSDSDVTRGWLTHECTALQLDEKVSVPS